MKQSSTSTAASAASTAAATSTAATPKLEATTPANKAVEAAATSADKKETPTLSAGQGVTANNTVVTEETAQTSGKKRDRRALGDANDQNLIGADVVDATSTPKVEKPGFTTDVDAKSMTSQITWLDFGDVANWTGAKNHRS